MMVVHGIVIGFCLVIGGVFVIDFVVQLLNQGTDAAMIGDLGKLFVLALLGGYAIGAARHEKDYAELHHEWDEYVRSKRGQDR